MDTFKKQIENFLPFLAKETGLAIRSDRIPFLQEKFAQRMGVCNIDTPERYVQLVRCSPEGKGELRNLVDLLTVGETYFFRNANHFKALVDNVLPELIDKKIRKISGNGSERPSLRIWCAGCSTGEEPYSLAMLLRENLPNFPDWEVLILATDINRMALDTAKLGRYGSRSVSRVPKEYLEKYFTVHGKEYSLSTSIKRMVEFTSHNLVGDLYAHEAMLDLDMIFCRNVTIYFDLATTKAVMSRFAEHLAPNGYIFIGHAETLWNVSDEFEPVELPGTFIYRKLAEGARRGEAKMPAPILPMPSYGVVGTTVAEPTYVELEKTELPDATPAAVAPELAEGEGERALKTDELMAKGTVLADQGEFEAALVHVRKATQEDNLCAPAYYLAGVLLEKQEEFEAAIEEFRHALYIDPSLTICYFNLGSIFKFLGRSKDAKREYKNCLKFLGGRDEDAEVALAEGMTVGVLSQAACRALELLNVDG